jgi:hypothetical protein
MKRHIAEKTAYTIFFPVIAICVFIKCIFSEKFCGELNGGCGIAGTCIKNTAEITTTVGQIAVCGAMQQAGNQALLKQQYNKSSYGSKDLQLSAQNGNVGAIATLNSNGIPFTRYQS